VLDQLVVFTTQVDTKLPMACMRTCATIGFGVVRSRMLVTLSRSLQERKHAMKSTHSLLGKAQSLVLFTLPQTIVALQRPTFHVIKVLLAPLLLLIPASIFAFQSSSALPGSIRHYLIEYTTPTPMQSFLLHTFSTNHSRSLHNHRLYPGSTSTCKSKPVYLMPMFDPPVT
jgi:hypothetical protein